MLSTFCNLNSCITYYSVSESFRKIIPDFNNTPVLGCTLIVKPKTNIMLTRIFYSQLTICSRGDAISKEKHAQHYTSFLTTYRHSTKSSTQHYSDILKKKQSIINLDLFNFANLYCQVVLKSPSVMI